MGNVTAVILAGGRGTRMDILCEVRPKPVLPFAGRFRVIDFSLSNCINSQISNIVVLTDYQRSTMADYVNRWHLMNANFTNLSISEPKGGSYSGTANAVHQNLGYFNKYKADAVLILAGDHVYKLDYRKMLAFHQSVSADVTVGVIPVPIEQAHRFGTVTLDANSRITDFVEKSPVPQSNLASMGIYVFNKNILAERLTEDDGDPSSRHDFGFSILPKMVKHDRVFAYKSDGYWQDIGTVESYYEVNMELIKEYPEFSLNGTFPVLTAEQYHLPPHIGDQAIVKNSLVSHGCVIKGRVENSILSPRVVVDEQAVVRNSIIMEDTFIGRHSIVDRSVLDEWAKVSDYCNVGFNCGLIPGDQGITLLGKGATVQPHAIIGRGCKVLPDVGSAGFFNDAVKLDKVGSRLSMSRI